MVKFQAYTFFLEHCIAHKTAPFGLRCSPNCPTFVEGKYFDQWELHVFHCSLKLLRTTICSLKATVKNLQAHIASRLSELRTLYSREYDSLLAGISYWSNLIFKQTSHTKMHKSLKILGCNKLSFSHKDTFTITPTIFDFLSYILIE